MQYIISKVKDNTEGQLDSAIGASALAIPLATGDGANFPVTPNGNTTASGSSNVLNATGIGASGIAVGDFIRNITDGSHAFVTLVSTNSVNTTTLLGGTLNTWANGDEYVANSFTVTLNKRDVDGNITSSEKALIKKRSGDILTVEQRGYDSSTAKPFDTNDYVSIFVEARLQEEQKKAFAEAFQELDMKASIAYVNSLLASQNFKDAVKVATTAPGTLASSFEAGDTIDGVVLGEGDRILIKDQADAKENGIYEVQLSGAPLRTSDADTGAEIDTAIVPVSQGTNNADTIWICTSDNPTLGVDDITFFNIGQALTFASQSEAEAGTNNTAIMTPLRVAQSARTRVVTAGETINGASNPIPIRILGAGRKAITIYSNAINWQNQSTQNFAEVDSNTRVSQGFILDDDFAATGDLMRLQMFIGRTGTSQPGNLIAEVYTNNGGVPSTTLVGASNTIASGSISTTGTYIEFIFSSLTLNTNTLYHFVIRSTSFNSNTNYYWVKYYNSNVYSNGTFATYNGSTLTWTANGSRDIGLHAEFDMNWGGIAVISNANGIGLNSDWNRIGFDGFAISNANAGQPLTIAYHGYVDGFTGLTNGALYYVDETSGVITDDLSSLNSNDASLPVGRAVSTTRIFTEKIPKSVVFAVPDIYRPAAASAFSFFFNTGSIPVQTNALAIDPTETFGDTAARYENGLRISTVFGSGSAGLFLSNKSVNVICS